MGQHASHDSQRKCDRVLQQKNDNQQN